jgi:NAD+ kinase
MTSVLIVAHTERRTICEQASLAALQLLEAGASVRLLADESTDVGVRGIEVVEAETAAHGTDAVLVLGGDGTFLRAAELARPAGVPMVGVNLGHVGFLAEAEPDSLSSTVDAIVRGAYDVEERVTVDADILVDGSLFSQAWALNEVSLERTNRERMLEIAVAVDERALLRFGCDGILCATPTGSTAYAFSAGGPVVWPSVQALLVVPLSAHALFARPLVVSPSSTVAVEMTDRQDAAVMFCDGRRTHQIAPQDRLEVVRSDSPVRLVRTRSAPFTDRLVDKFKLPVQGWSGR